MTDKEYPEPRPRLQNAVERIVASPEEIARKVFRLHHDPEDVDTLARRIVSHYGNSSAIAGAATSAPAGVPVFGALAFAGLTMADMVLLLKIEVEMCMALLCAHGYDIRRPEERQRAFLLAAVKTHQVSGGRRGLADAADIGASAFWQYGPRELSKMFATVFAALATNAVVKKLGVSSTRVIPGLGMVVSAGVNKALTSRVGTAAHREIALRRSAEARTPV